MEGFSFDPEFGWNPDKYILLSRKEADLRLHWANTHVYRFEVGDGAYDYIDHYDAEGISHQFFVDETELGEDLDKRGYPVTTQAFVSDEVVAARREHDMEQGAAELAQELENVNGPDDFLQL